MQMWARDPGESSELVQMCGAACLDRDPHVALKWVQSLNKQIPRDVFGSAGMKLALNPTKCSGICVSLFGLQTSGDHKDAYGAYAQKASPMDDIFFFKKKARHGRSDVTLKRKQDSRDSLC